jgi:hypothetical protein
MQRVTFADHSLLLGDEAALVLLEYAAALASNDRADTVALNAISSDGDDIVATFLLNSGSPLMAESATTNLDEPENAASVAYMFEKLRLIKHPITVVPVARDNVSDFDQPGAIDDIAGV